MFIKLILINWNQLLNNRYCLFLKLLNKIINQKKTYILGISAFYHDSAACIIIDGIIIAAAQEERFTRKKIT